MGEKKTRPITSGHGVLIWNSCFGRDRGRKTKKTRADKKGERKFLIRAPYVVRAL